MPYKNTKFGHYSTRRDYSKIATELPLPDLTEIQTKMYDWFLKDGIQDVFDTIFPISNQMFTKNLTIVSWHFLEPRCTVKQAKHESKTFEAPLYVTLELTLDETNFQIPLSESQKDIKEFDIIKSWIESEFGFKKYGITHDKDTNTYHFTVNKKVRHGQSLQDQMEVTVLDRTESALVINFTVWFQGEVFFGDFPMMTPKGTFVINGSEKVIVSQLVRSPGVSYKLVIDNKTGEKLHLADIMPSRGTWLEIESVLQRVKGATEKQYVLQYKLKIDKSRRLQLSTLFTALGLDRAEILTLFNNNKALTQTYEYDINLTQGEAVQEIYRKIRSDETSTPDGATKFLINLLFSRRKYDLSKTGRFKLRDKLFVINNILNRVLAQDIHDVDGNLIFKKGKLITRDEIEKLETVLKAGACLQEIKMLDEIDGPNKVQIVKVYLDNEVQDEIINLIGINPLVDLDVITVPDIVAAASYFVNLSHEIGTVDDIDNLANRRVRSVGELLQNQFQLGLSRIEKNVKEKMSTLEFNRIRPNNLINCKPLTSVIGEFFNLSQLSQFMDQTNPLSELTNKRRLTTLGPGGLTRERAGLEVRDVHESHYGRICPIETPEGPNVGLINNLASYASVNKYGFLETPYRRVINQTLTDQIIYLSSIEERYFTIGQADVEVDENRKLINKNVLARFNAETIKVNSTKLDLIDVSPKQVVSVAAACIPFLENDDASRALMGANMQRQAVPLLNPDSPVVGTGIEYIAAHDSGAAVLAEADGVVKYVDNRSIVIQHEKHARSYELACFERSNQGTAITQTPLVKVNEKVEKGQTIADGPAMQNGELALGQNVLVAFTTWRGYNYEDAVIVSERLVKDDVYTSIHIEEYSIERRITKQGDEEITNEIPNVPESASAHLDSNGIVLVGVDVKEGDILVGKVTPKGQTQLSPEDRLLHAIFGEKSRGVKDNSLRVPHGGDGTVQAIKHFTRATMPNLPTDVLEVVKVYIVQKRKIQTGDKMAGRHGNKGVISNVLPVEDMPHLEDGTPIDIMLNPLGVPSRMNVGQVLELHLGFAAQKLGLKVATPVFEGANQEDLQNIMTEAGISKTGKMKLIDGRTGEPFDKLISVGVMYMLKLSHMVDDKLHARNVGPYSLITQQPLGGRAQNGGQRFGEMEVWALEAYGASRLLQEILTIKSDDIKGRTKAYESIIRGKTISVSGVPESFNVLTRELQGLGINIKLYDRHGELSVQDYYNKDDNFFANSQTDQNKQAKEANKAKIEPEKNNPTTDDDDLENDLDFINPDESLMRTSTTNFKKDASNIKEDNETDSKDNKNKNKVVKEPEDLVFDDTIYTDTEELDFDSDDTTAEDIFDDDKDDDTTSEDVFEDDDEDENEYLYKSEISDDDDEEDDFDDN